METIRRGTARADAVTLLQQLLQQAGHQVPLDGRFGVETDSAVREFQRRHGLVVDGVFGPQSWAVILGMFPDRLADMAKTFLSEEDIEVAARRLRVEVAAIKAVTEVEALGQGFIAGKPKILFERHVFWKRLRLRGIDPTKHAAGNHDILARTRGGYLGGIREYGRLEQARTIDDEAALASTSWGMFQVMGFQALPLGYTSVADFVSLMGVSEGEHLNAFVRYVEVNRLAPLLQSLDWVGFAKRYNGKDFAKNKYDARLAQAYARHQSA